uniref:Putative ovule protein n=1 Tax=Solanum chacoense TaxID=4108 RepID=A0A0V0GTC6_SOLCH
MNPIFKGRKLSPTCHHTSISGNILGLFCVDPVSVSVCVAPCHLSGNYFFNLIGIVLCIFLVTTFLYLICVAPCHPSGDYFLIYNLHSTVPSFFC